MRQISIAVGFLALLFIRPGLALSQNQQVLVAENNAGAQAFFTAEKLWREGQPILASRQWRKVLNDVESPPLFKTVAFNRLAAPALSDTNYSSAITYNPRSTRKYNTDTFYISVNGVDLPFSVNREENVFNTISFNQKFVIPVEFESRFSGVELVTLTHTANLKSNDSIENILTSMLHIANPSTRYVSTWKKTFTYNQQPDDLSTQDEFKLTYVGTKLSSSAALSYFRHLNVTDTEKRSEEYIKFSGSLIKQYNHQSLRVHFDRHFYRDSLNNFTSVKVNSSRQLPNLGAIFTASVDARFEDNPSFPFRSKRTDKLVKLSASKQLDNLKFVDTVNVQFSRNYSNIDIYDYEEVGVSLSLNF